MDKKWFLLFLSVFFCYSLSAQKTEITGMVTDSAAHSPVEGVVVKATYNQKLIAFGTTNKSGKYRLEFDGQQEAVTIHFQHISYNGKTQNATSQSREINVSLSAKTFMLREVSVAAPAVMQKTDTVSFNVGSFKAAGDRSIEDVIKKLPGVNVTNEGKIAYQGKDISKFNIEGEDMLGGKYTLASRNIQAKDVNRVEMIENYQDIKQLRGKEYSDKVALNLKLTKEAQMRLLGTMELGGGCRDDEALYHGVLTAMMFGKKKQFIGTLKTNNWGNALSTETVNFFGSDNITNVVERVMKSDLSSSPPLTPNRFQQKNDLMTSINSLFKINEDVALRVNADYSRERKEFRFETVQNYYTNSNTIAIVESQAPQFLKNTLKATLDIQINSKKTYLDNAVSVMATDVNNRFGLITNGSPVQQQITNQLKGIQNRFRLYKKTGKREINFNSVVSYSQMPDNRLSITGVPATLGDFYQTGSGKSFSTSNSTSLGYDLSRVSMLSLSLSVNANYDRIDTRLQRGDSALMNRNKGYKMTTSLSPEYRLQSLSQRFGLTIGLPLNFYNIGYKNLINPKANLYYNAPVFSPKVKGHYIFSAFTKFEFNAGINNSIGDITDFIVNPIQISYNQQTVKSGILAKSNTLSSQLDVELKNPVKLFFSNYSVSYSKTRYNILNSQTVSTGPTNTGISTSGMADENRSHSISFSGNASKAFIAIGTTLSIQSSYTISNGIQVRQGIKTDIHSSGFSVSPGVKTKISKQLELNYSINYSLSSQHAINFSTIYHQQSHNLFLTYNPLGGFILYGSMDFSRREITTNNYKNMQLFDAGIRYKFKKTEAELKFNNLFNSTRYSYTVVNQLDVFSYKYTLNPREVVLICKFNL